MRRAALTLLLAACGGADDTDDPCLDAPVVTWDNHGRDIIVEHCQACHGSGVEDRYGAPAAVVFDTEDDVLDRAEQVLAVATGPSPSMPPAGGVDEVDRRRLEVWLTCWR